LQPTQMTTFQFFQAKKQRKFAGSGTFPQKENKISPALPKKEIPTLVQAKHTLTCMRRNRKSLQEIASGFQIFLLFIFSDSGFLQGEKMSFLVCLTLGSVPTNTDSGRCFVVIYSQLTTELAQL